MTKSTAYRVIAQTPEGELLADYIFADLEAATVFKDRMEENGNIASISERGV